MRRLVVAYLVLFGALGIVAWKAAPSTLIRQTASPAATVTANSSVSGNYSLLLTYRDSETNQQDGSGAGTLVFDGAGNLSGVISENSRCGGPSCGDAVVIRAAFSGTYTVYPDRSSTLVMCITITNAVVAQGGSPTAVSQSVQVIWEGSFSRAGQILWLQSPVLSHGTFIQTLIGACGSPASSMVQSPNNSVATLDKA